MNSISTHGMFETDFPRCPICSTQDWKLLYSGPIRDGSFGHIQNAEVRSCSACRVHRVSENVCLNHQAYESENYRLRLSQDHDVSRHYAIHDELARFALDILWPESLRDKTIADIGCGGGSLLDHLRGLTGQIIAIDPDENWRLSLKSRGYDWFPSIEQALSKWKGQVDYCLSTQVIEHVENPRDFIASIKGLLRPNGIAIVSTPNNHDILMEMLPEEFPSFFYRTQHRWSFDADSLRLCAEFAEVKVLEVRHVHRYGIANALYWLKDKRPRGRTPFLPLDSNIDKLWQTWLETTGRADNLFLIFQRID